MTPVKSDVTDLIGAPTNSGEISSGPKELTQPQTSTLIVDDRVIPDATLPTEVVSGVLDIANEGSGLLRPKSFSPSDRDVYISASQIRRFNLRVGDVITGAARRPKENERYWGLLKVEQVNGVPVEKVPTRPNFDDLTVIYPESQIKLSTDKDTLTTRIIDLISPIGFGQRSLIVSPPKAGKTWLVKDIIAGIAKNYPEEKENGVHIMAVLIFNPPDLLKVSFLLY